MPLISVVIPAYNQGRYLAEAIRSVLGQTFTNFEAIIVDDGSTDDTREVAAAFTDPRVRYVRQRNQGLSAARNTGIRHASGGLLSFLDSDDCFLPHKLERLVAALRDDPGLGMVAGQAVLIDETGRRLGEVFDRSVPADPSELLLGNPLHVGSVLLRRDWLERVGLFDESLRSYEDWDMWLRLARAGCRMASVAEPVSLYRFHTAQMTRLSRQMTTATFAVLDKVFAEPETLPPAWRQRRDEAYSRASLRAAAQAYTARDFARASEHMAAAVRFDPSLRADSAERLARMAAAWANHAKTAEPLAFLAGVYAHLPEELAMLRARRRTELAREALHLAATARARGDAETARRRARQALRYRPLAVLDRGVLSMLFWPDNRAGEGNA